jgi:hypothetical protein
MKNAFHSFQLPVLLLVASALAGCNKEAAVGLAAPEQKASVAAGLEGTWRLTERQCFCQPGQKVPNEVVTFTATTFAFSKNNSPISSGTYSRADSASMCGQVAKTPALRFVYTAGPGSALRNPSINLAGDTLTMDYGIACDAPRETYVRLQ